MCLRFYFTYVPNFVPKFIFRSKVSFSSYSILCFASASPVFFSVIDDRLSPSVLAPEFFSPTSLALNYFCFDFCGLPLVAAVWLVASKSHSMSSAVIFVSVDRMLPFRALCDSFLVQKPFRLCNQRLPCPSLLAFETLHDFTKYLKLFA